MTPRRRRTSYGPEFRQWALSSGYKRGRIPVRVPDHPYSPDDIDLSFPTQFITQQGNIVETRSMLEALWIAELEDCSFQGYEPQTLTCAKTKGKKSYTGRYTPDLLIKDDHGPIFVELKPDKEKCKDEKRPSGCLELDDSLRFMVIGGYPDSERGFTVRLITREIDKTYQNVTMAQLKILIGCL